MQHVFGFIDYKKNNFSDFKMKISNNHQTIYEEYSKYSFCLSYSEEHASQVLNNRHFFLFLEGEIHNISSLYTLLYLDPSTHSTLDLLQVAYSKWGTAFLEHLEGNFSLILYDKEQELLSLAKDKIGIIPLSYYHNNELIVFGSRIQDFKQAPGFIPEISPDGLVTYLQFGYLIQPNSILKGCHKVKSGQANHFDLSTKEMFTTLHWNLESCYQEDKLFPNEFKIINEADALLNNALSKIDLNCDKVALSLSGGYDSSTIAALLKKQNRYELETFTIGFEDERINEAPYAKAIAKHLNIQHHEHYFTSHDALEIIPQLAQIYDEPFANHAAAPTILTNALIKKEGIEHLFVGDGGDEVFATADDIHFFRRIQTLPLGLRTSITKILQSIDLEVFSSLEDHYNFPTKFDKLLRMFSGKNIPQMTEARNTLFREKELQGMVRNYQQPITTTFNEIHFTGFHETVDEIIGTYFKTTMIDGELVKTYSASNHQNIQIHAPFLDEELIQYMAKVPSSIKIKGGTKKYILKEILHQYLPQHLLDRPKSGFHVPFASWMRNEFKSLVYEQINEERLNKDKLFYTSSIIKIRDKFYEGHEIYKYKLWRIFLFQLWYENFKG